MLLFVKTSGDISHRVGDLGQTCCCLLKHLVISAIGWGSGTDMLFVKTSGDISHRVGYLGQTCCCLLIHLAISAIG